jgi:hypothetical protein
VKSSWILFIYVLLVSAAYSQITVTSADYQKTLGLSISTTRNWSSDTSGLTSVLGASGAGKTWNLAGRTYTAGETSTATLLDKSSSGAPQQNASAFSSANFVVRRRSTSKPLFTDWTYLSVTTTALSYCGYASDSVGILKSLQTNVPSQRSQNYPTTYPGNWSWSSTVTSTTYTGSMGVGASISMGGSDVVDAYGTVTTPEGSFPCLRIKRRSDLLLGFFTITSYSYEFVDQNRTYASIDAGSTGTVPSSVTYYRQEAATDIQANASNQPNSFQLLQNYPNPFNPGTTIQYILLSYSHASVKIYNLLGQQVAALVDEVEQPGTYRVNWRPDLPSGIYFCRLQAGGSVQTRKLVLQK